MVLYVFSLLLHTTKTGQKIEHQPKHSYMNNRLKIYLYFIGEIKNVNFVGFTEICLKDQKSPKLDQMTPVTLIIQRLNADCCFTVSSGHHTFLITLIKSPTWAGKRAPTWPNKGLNSHQNYNHLPGCL